MAESFENVMQFLCADDKPIEYLATILLRPADMVIDIPLQPAGGPYLVRGERTEQFFAGKDKVRDLDSVDVVARWTKLGDVWVGVWIEDGIDYLFTFRLPSHVSGSRR